MVFTAWHSGDVVIVTIIWFIKKQVFDISGIFKVLVRFVACDIGCLFVTVFDPQNIVCHICNRC